MSCVNNKNPSAISPIPKPTERLPPKRCTMRGVNGVTTSMIPAMGNSRIAVSRAENPRTSWKYCVMSSITPYIARNTSIMAPLPTLNEALRK